MKITKISINYIVVTIFVYCGLCIAEPIGTVFTYQGWFMDANELLAKLSQLFFRIITRNFLTGNNLLMFVPLKFQKPFSSRNTPQ